MNRKTKKSEIGDRLRVYRHQRDLKPKDVAKAVGVAVTTYREWENGRRISGEPYLALAKLFQIPVAELLSGEPIPNSRAFDQLENIESLLKNLKETLRSSF